MKHPLATYLDDHLGGSNLAVELLEKWRSGSKATRLKFGSGGDEGLAQRNRVERRRMAEGKTVFAAGKQERD